MITFKFLRKPSRKIENNVNELKKHFVKVGVFGGNHMDGTPLAEIAAAHEFGVKKSFTFVYKGEKITVRGLPTRSFLRGPLRVKKSAITGLKNRKKIKATLFDEIKNGYTGKTLELMGVNAVNIIHEAFKTQGYGEWEPNISERYIELKGSNRPLRDTGLLENSISHKVE